MEDGGLSVVSAVQALAKAHKIKVAEEQALVEVPIPFLIRHPSRELVET